MEIINNIIKSEAFLIGVAVVNLLLLILYVCNLLKLKKINKNYKSFMKKLGNGNNIEEMLQKYITKVEEVNGKSEEILNYCTRLDKDISLCIKKMGMVRYSAFKDTGSDLSFALALCKFGGEGGIRTHGRLQTYANFQDWCHKPTRPPLHIRDN